MIFTRAEKKVAESRNNNNNNNNKELHTVKSLKVGKGGYGVEVNDTFRT